MNSISIGDLAKFDPQSIPPSEDNFTKLKQAVENIENMLANTSLEDKQTQSLKALKVMLGARAVVIGNQTGNGEAANKLVQSMQTSNTRYKYHTEYVGRKPIKDAATFMKDQLEFVQLEFKGLPSVEKKEGSILSLFGTDNIFTKSRGEQLQYLNETVVSKFGIPTDNIFTKSKDEQLKYITELVKDMKDVSQYGRYLFNSLKQIVLGIGFVSKAVILPIGVLLSNFEKGKLMLGI